ncbi:MAG: LysR family transcriptional regulator [Salinisphaeraceae bacterium]|nr:LysR family transcriptional regulator [Salinisphaeraceae bacterium]
MSSHPQISLEHWRALLAVVEAGGYAQAAQAVNKSQSTISYAIAKIEHLLDVKLFEIEGRKAVLTPTGELLARRARLLVNEANNLETAATELARGCEAEISLAVDHLFPYDILLRSLGRFSATYPNTRVQLHETVLSGNEEALIEGRADLAVTPIVPVGFMGDLLMPIRFMAVAHPDHELHKYDRALTYLDLRQYRQIVIRDSGIKTKRDAGWLGAEQRWTVSHMTTSIQAVSMGLGFAWLPVIRIGDELERGLLKPLNMREGGERQANLQIVFADRDYAGPAAQSLAALLKEESQGMHINRQW